MDSFLASVQFLSENTAPCRRLSARELSLLHRSYRNEMIQTRTPMPRNLCIPLMDLLLCQTALPRWPSAEDRTRACVGLIFFRDLLDHDAHFVDAFRTKNFEEVASVLCFARHLRSNRFAKASALAALDLQATVSDPSIAPEVDAILGIISFLSSHFGSFFDWRRLVPLSLQPTVASALPMRGASRGMGPAGGRPSLVLGASLYDVPGEGVVGIFGSSVAMGLPAQEAARRLKVDGANVLRGPSSPSVARILWHQLSDFMVIVLLAAALLSASIRDYKAAVVLLVVVFTNTVIGFFQEWKAERLLMALQGTFTATLAAVVRDGRICAVRGADLARGDIVLLQEGQIVPADLRLLETNGLLVDEASLTGESLPVEKNSGLLRARSFVPLADRSNMAFMGTLVTTGSGRGVVVAVGMTTEVGQLCRDAAELSKNSSSTDSKPGQLRLHKQIASLGRVLVIGSFLLCGILLLIGLHQHRSAHEMVLVSVSLAVSAIPEGLLCVTTITLSLGVRRLSRRNVLVRRLAALEAVGATSLVCSDKTGTLTLNEMQVASLWIAGSYAGAGHFLQRLPEVESYWSLPGLVVLVCVLAQPSRPTDPTDIALLDFGNLQNASSSGRGGGWRDLLSQGKFSVLAAHDFDADRKRMSVFVQDLVSTKRRRLLLVKGAVESVLSRCCYTVQSEFGIDLGHAVENQSVVLTPFRTEAIEQALREMAVGGLRVVALAFRQVADDDDLARSIADVDRAESDLIFLALVGLTDPPRPEAAEAIAACRDAGIRVVELSGDYLGTCWTVARRIGLVSDSAASVSSADGALTGSQLDRLDTSQDREICAYAVFARMSPTQKLRVVRAFAREGDEVVTVVGDGSNDLGALKAADCAIAMGRTGTEISRSCADIIILDDSLQSVVAAVHEGRLAKDNIRKFIIYILECNLAEIFVMLVCVIAGLPIPFTATMILWANLVVDIPTSIALAFEEEDPAIMRRPPPDRGESIVPFRFVPVLVASSVALALWTVAGFVVWLNVGVARSLRESRTFAFMLLSAMQIFHSLTCRRLDGFALRPSLLLQNRALVFAIALSLALLVLGAEVPGLNSLLELDGLVWLEWLVVGLSVVTELGVAEMLKWCLLLPVRTLRRADSAGPVDSSSPRSMQKSRTAPPPFLPRQARAVTRASGASERDRLLPVRLPNV